MNFKISEQTTFEELLKTACGFWEITGETKKNYSLFSQNLEHIMGLNS